MREINYKARMKQVHNFTRIQRKGKIAPMDIDGLIDYGGRAFLYLEGKSYGAEIPYGQKLALENIVKSHWKAGHPAAAFIYFHDTHTSQDVMVDECEVGFVFTQKEHTFEWTEVSIPMLKAIERFESKFFT